MDGIVESSKSPSPGGGARQEPGCRTSSIAGPVLQFLRHFAEMSLAMVVGMLLLGPLCQRLMNSLGYPDPVHSAPWLAILLMAFTMALPMVLWMAYRGHGWSRSFEMAASMFVPAAALIALWAAGILSGCQAHCALHTLMWPSMLFVMLLRYKAYSGGGHTHVGVA